MDCYDELWGFAEDHFGLITVAQAKALGVSNANLVMMERRGTLMRLGRGLYQVKHHVVGPYDSYAIAVAQVGDSAYLRGASVLGLRRIVPTDLSVIFVGTPDRLRKRVSDYVVTKDRTPAATEIYEGIRCERLSDAIVSAAKDGALDADRINEAFAETQACGLISSNEAKQLRERIKA